MLKQLIYHVIDTFKLNKNPINPGQNRPGHQGLYQFSRRGYPIPPHLGGGEAQERKGGKGPIWRRQRNSVLLTSPTEPPSPTLPLLSPPDPPHLSPGGGRVQVLRVYYRLASQPKQPNTSLHIIQLQLYRSKDLQSLLNPMVLHDKAYAIVPTAQRPSKNHSSSGDKSGAVSLRSAGRQNKPSPLLTRLMHTTKSSARDQSLHVVKLQSISQLTNFFC